MTWLFDDFGNTVWNGCIPPAVKRGAPSSLESETERFEGDSARCSVVSTSSFAVASSSNESEIKKVEIGQGLPFDLDNKVVAETVYESGNDLAWSHFSAKIGSNSFAKIKRAI